MDKILRIDVGAPGGPKATVEPLGDYAGLGGRAMTSLVVAKEVPADCHPLGPENKLVISPGIASGSAASSSGRLSIGCKSPLTGTIKESNAGGQPSMYIARLGYAAIIIEGEHDRNAGFHKIVISESGVAIEKADDLAGLRNYATAEKIKEKHGDKVALISIGTAGEMRMASASIACTDPEFRPTRHAGRGGVGAVMGSKGIKCIVVDPGGAKMRQPANPDAFKEANRKFVEGLRGHAVTGQGLPTYGTNVLTNILCEAGGYPTYNFKEGQFKGAEKISGETLADTEKVRGGNPTHGCHRGCAIQCSGVFVDKDGNYVTKQPEYETVWAHGGNCGIDDLDTIAKLDFMDDDIGVDTIEMGVTIGVAMDAGVIPFGDAEGALKLVEEVGQGTPLGRILGAGAAVTAKCFGLERAPVVKSQAMPAYDPRAVKGVGVTYATTTQGADHTAGYAVATNILKVGGDVDPLSATGQAELSRNLQIATAALDATGFCLFVAFAILDQPETFQAMIDTLNALNGTSMTADDVVALGQQVLKAEREFNEKAGFTKAHDRLPRYFSREKLPPHNVVFDVPDEELDSVFNF
ncbi:aldehyde ferredoxin oxidoreductase [Oceanidesulfovibrio indonesiensis]|uniref:Aldehyde ferredoxin oxidoreductase n=1 Tax=Oceanidesulfovibrio indonesiensis TaxID=54767 RepID=A0A7M3MC04_9BACT|nr:aldehyde ferredoxin oxidoreductase C-terminal domain-containing protein [Oceanidesulfovibrio indonesiensis]TVM15384.1 aldehyde ferredoxin oxidoreductase [Oceanidesulfovibrio indonesiensis]